MSQRRAPHGPGRHLAQPPATSAGRGLPELRPEFPVLDTVRLIGALAVLTTHTAFQAGDYLRYGAGGTMLARLDVGVAIFFVLSGFLLGRPYLARAAHSLPAPAVRPYYVKRFLRIYPVYAITVVIALALLSENDGAGPLQWIDSLLLADAYTSAQLPHGLTHMWSLTAEVSFYLILPGVMWLAVGGRAVLDTRRVGLALALLVAVSVAWHVWIDQALDPLVRASTGIWLPAYLTWFAVGIFLAWVHVRLQSGSAGRGLVFIRDLARMPGVCWSLAAGLMLAVSTPVAGPTLFQVGTAGESLVKHLLYAAVGALVVMTGIWTRPGHYSTVMSTRPLRHLGHISYSIFCIHLAVISLVMWMTGYELFLGHGLQIWLLTVAITIVAAELLYAGVERPFLQRKDRVAGPPEETRIAQTTATTE